MTIDTAILLGAMASIIGFFLKNFHSKVEIIEKEIEKQQAMYMQLEKNFEVLEKDYMNKIDKLTQVTEMQITSLTKNIDKLANTVGNMNDKMDNMNTNLIKIAQKVKL